MEEIILTKYSCGNCGAGDSDKSTNPPRNLICWSCRSGSRTSVPEAEASGVGMFPVREG